MQPRGPLPSRVYWTRRLVVLGVALLLVVGLARLLSTGSDASSEASSDDAATTVAEQGESTATESTEADPSESAGSPAGTESSEGSSEESPEGKASRTPLPAPEGECEPSDIAVQPVVRKAYAAQDVRIRFRLRTREAEACTWQVSPETMTVKITSGPDDIWFSSECPRELPTEDVVLRSEKATTVEMTWNTKRSDDECSRFTEWAMPGDYHVIAAALAGEPTDLQFTLEQAVSETITKTITPKPRPKRR